MMENTTGFGTELTDEDRQVLAQMSGSVAPTSKDMPSIDHLEDAVKFDEAGRPYLDLRPGQQVVVERRIQMFPEHPWLDTKVYHINEVDQATGRLKLFYEELQQHVRDNFVGGIRVGARYKKLPKVGRWDVAPKVVRKPAPQQEAAAQAADPSGAPAKKGRGRPKGVKNRSKEVIAAEKEALKEARLARKAARLARRAGR